MCFYFVWIFYFFVFLCIYFFFNFPPIPVRDSISIVKNPCWSFNRNILFETPQVITIGFRRVHVVVVCVRHSLAPTKKVVKLALYTHCCGIYNTFARLSLCYRRYIKQNIKVVQFCTFIYIYLLFTQTPVHLLNISAMLS